MCPRNALYGIQAQIVLCSYFHKFYTLLSSKWALFWYKFNLNAAAGMVQNCIVGIDFDSTPSEVNACDVNIILLLFSFFFEDV